MNKPKVSILCLTYNHEKYIKQALDSFLTQKTKFNYEILIHDDASTDKTVDILKKYQKKYPEIIKIFFEKENQYSKGICGMTSKSLLPMAKGEYISLCEGDDFFTNNNKLQQQADFLDKNKDYTICFHPVEVFFENKENKNFILPLGKNFNLKKLLNCNFIATSSVMYRRINYKKIPKTNYIPGDWYLHLYHAKYGKIGFINKIMSSYRKHTGGVWWNADHNRDKWLIKNGYLNITFYIEIIKLYEYQVKYLKYIFINIHTLLQDLIKIDKKYKKNNIEKIFKEYNKEIIFFYKNFYTNFNRNKKTEKENIKLKSDLYKIQSSKTYKVWQKYNYFKKKILKLIVKNKQ